MEHDPPPMRLHHTQLQHWLDNLRAMHSVPVVYNRLVVLFAGLFQQSIERMQTEHLDSVECDLNGEDTRKMENFFTHFTGEDDIQHSHETLEEQYENLYEVVCKFYRIENGGTLNQFLAANAGPIAHELARARAARNAFEPHARAALARTLAGRN